MPNDRFASLHAFLPSSRFSPVRDFGGFALCIGLTVAAPLAAFADAPSEASPPSATAAPAPTDSSPSDAAPAPTDSSPSDAAPAPTDSSAASGDAKEKERVESTLVVTASRIARPKRAVSAPVEVLDKKAIEKSGARNLAELLAQRSLADVRSYGGIGGLQIPSLRGMSGEQTLVLLDGRRLNPPQGGGVDLTDVNLQGVRRVEILHGPASALYGSDAMGGVIQLFTDSPEGPARNSLSEETGSYGYRALQFSRSERMKRLGYVFSAGTETSQGDYPYFNAQRQATLHRVNAGYNDNFIRTTLQPELKSGRLSVDLDWSDSKRGAPGPIESPSKATQEDRLSSILADYQGDLKSSRFGGVGIYEFKAHAQEMRRVYDALQDKPIASYTRQIAKTSGLEALARRRYGESSLTVGGEYRRETINGNQISDHHRDVVGTYALGEIPASGWTILPAARWDSIASVGSQVSPQIGLVRKITPSWTMRANLGRAFRAPSFDDLYWPEDSFSVGNPTLKPERATTGDLGATFAQGKWDASLTAFQTDAKNLITWTTGAYKPGKWSPINVGRARLRGLELTANRPAGDWDFGAGATYLKTEDRTPGGSTYGEELTYRPKESFHLNADWKKSVWGAGADFVYDGKRYISADNASALGGYALVNLRVLRDLGNWEARIDLMNLFDRRYVVQAGYPIPGREARIELRQQF